jgi:hypothetical protein
MCGVVVNHPHQPLILTLRSRRISAFTRVFDALWRGVSKGDAPIFNRPQFVRASSFETALRASSG